MTSEATIHNLTECEGLSRKSNQAATLLQVAAAGGRIRMIGVAAFEE